MSFDIKLDEAQIKALASAAIVQAISQQGRDAIICQAVDFLLTPKESSYSSRKVSPIQEAFTRALEQTAREVALEMIEKDERVRARLLEMLVAAHEQVLVAGRDNMVKKIAEAVERGLSERSY